MGVVRPSVTAALLLFALCGATGPAAAQAADRPVVAELFTSQGCSSCPPADALLSDLARSRPEVLALAFHVTYWNDLGWRDPFSLEAATERQRAYARSIGDSTIYTPELVVEGARGVIGSDPEAVDAALREAHRHLATAGVVRLTRQGDSLVIGVGTGSGAAAILLVGYDPQRRTAVGRGENGGRTLLEANIVRSVQVLGGWTGGAVTLRHAVPEGEAFALLLQAADGRILGAARLSSASS